MKEKVKKILRDKLSRDILAFFYQHQSSIDTAGGVSTWVHNERSKVQEVLDKLVQLGILEEDSIGSIKGYCYTRSKKTMKIIQELMKGNE